MKNADPSESLGLFASGGLMQLSIAGLTLNISGVSRLSDNMKCFVSENRITSDTDIVVKAVAGLRAMRSGGHDAGDADWYGRDDGSCTVVFRQRKFGYRYLRVDADSNWRNVGVTRLFWLSPETDSLDAAAELVFRYLLPLYGGLQIHASAVETRFGTLLFSAASGVGKSTQAKLWEKIRGGRILNSDRPALRLANGAWQAFGLPWSGSEPVCLNASSPVRAIILLEQSLENTCQHIRTAEAIRNLTPRVFLPYFQPESLPKSFDAISGLCADIPMYRLCCTPDERAVEVLEACLVG